MEGPRGNVLAMVPHLTKPLGPAGVPRDDTFPLCTLRYFPSTIQHTLQVGCAAPAPAPSEEAPAPLPSFPVSRFGRGSAAGRIRPQMLPAGSPSSATGPSLSLPLGLGSQGAQGGGSQCSAPSPPLQWARDEFEGLFQLPAEHVNRFME